MDVLRASLREFGQLVETMFNGAPGEAAARPQPRRGALWVVAQVLAMAVLLGALLAVAAMVFDPPDVLPESPAVRLSWAVPGSLLTLPLFLHWFAAPPRRGAGAAAGLVTALVVGVAASPLVTAAGWPDLWTGLVTLTVALVAAGAVFGAISMRPAHLDA